MPFETLTLGLTLTIPTNGTRNWGTIVRNSTWTKISQHNHTGAGDGKQMVTNSYADNSVTSAKLAKNVGLTQQGPIDAAAGNTINVDLDDGNIALLDLDNSSGDITISLSNPVEGSLYRLLITQGPAARGLTWPGTVIWPQGQAHGVLSGAQPATISETNNAVDQIIMYYNGTNFYADFELDYQ